MGDQPGRGTLIVQEQTLLEFHELVERRAKLPNVERYDSLAMPGAKYAVDQNFEELRAREQKLERSRSVGTSNLGYTTSEYA